MREFKRPVLRAIDVPGSDEPGYVRVLPLSLLESLREDAAGSALGFMQALLGACVVEADGVTPVYASTQWDELATLYRDQTRDTMTAVLEENHLKPEAAEKKSESAPS